MLQPPSWGRAISLSCILPLGIGSGHPPCDPQVHPPGLRHSTLFLVPHKLLQHIRAAVLVVTGTTAEIWTGLGEQAESMGSDTHFTVGWGRDRAVHQWPTVPCPSQNSTFPSTVTRHKNVRLSLSHPSHWPPLKLWPPLHPALPSPLGHSRAAPPGLLSPPPVYWPSDGRVRFLSVSPTGPLHTLRSPLVPTASGPSPESSRQGLDYKGKKFLHSSVKGDKRKCTRMPTKAIYHGNSFGLTPWRMTQQCWAQARCA